MIVTHYTALKVLAVYSVIALSAIALNPTLEVAVIVAVPGTIAGMGTIFLGLLARKDARELRASQAAMQTSIDGHFSKLLDEKQKQGEQLVDKTDRLAHAEGRREGVEATEEKKGTP